MKLLSIAAMALVTFAAPIYAKGGDPVLNEIDNIGRSATMNGPAPMQAQPYAPVQPYASAQPGRIIMYRQGAMIGLALGCPIRFKGQELVELGRNKFAEWVVPAGSYILANKTGSVDVNVFPGQTKFVRCVIKPGFMSGRADLQIVDEETFAQHSADYERKEISPMFIQAAR